MPHIGEIDYHVQGDIGGVGVSRFRFTRQDAANITSADCNAVAAAARALLQGMVSYIPSGITWTCSAQANVYDVATGLVAGPLVVTVLPATVSGTGGTSFSAGTGARLNWKTSTVSGRRLLKGATFLVPLSSVAFATNGGVAAAAVTAANNAAATYLSALTSAQLYPQIWHRPGKGQSSGGTVGIVYAGTLSTVPAGLRSRRT